MAYTAPASPNLLTDPGVLFWAPLGSTLPSNTVVGSVFTDTWPVAWIPLGMTDTGSTWSYAITTQTIDAAETFYPLSVRTTGVAASMTTTLKSFTATNLGRAMNGATLTTTGSGTTLLTQVDPPAIGSEVRCMVGFESFDSTVRAVGFQCLNAVDVAIAMAKAPANASIPFQFQFEKPSSTNPVRWWTAGANRG